MVDTAPNPAQVWLTGPGAVVTEKVVAAVLAVVTLAAGTIGVVVADAVWVDVLWVAGSLLLLLIAAGMWAVAGENARATAALRASGVPARAEVLAAEMNAGDDVSFSLTLWITPPGGVGCRALTRPAGVRPRHGRCPQRCGG